MSLPETLRAMGGLTMFTTDPRIPSRTWRALLFLSAVLLGPTLHGCGDSSSRPPNPDERMAQEMAQRLQNERRQREREAERYRVQLETSKEDLRGVVLIWASTAAR